MTAPALLFAGLMVALAGLQIALAAGAPYGQVAWGGNHRVLPTTLRIGSILSLLLYALMGQVVLDRATLVDVFPDDVARIGVWVVSAYCLVGIAMNAISRSKSERLVMVPVATLLFVSSLLVALGPA